MSKIQELIQELYISFQELDRLLFDEESDHILGKPCTMRKIVDLENSLGFSFPPSYREFLMLHNGWNRFDGDAKLLAIEDFRSDWVLKKISNLEILFFEEEEQSPFAEGMIPILLGEDNNNFLLLDPNTVKSSGEMDFVAYDFTEEEARFPDFISFLEFNLQSIKRIIDDEINGKTDN